MVGVEQWAEIRRLHFVEGCRSGEIGAADGAASQHDPAGVAPASEPPGYRRAPAGSKLDPFKDEIHRLLREDPKLPGVRVRELLEPLGCDGGKTIVDDYLREVRPLFAPPPRTFQRTVYRPGEICQFDLWQPRDEIPVGHGQTRRGWVVVACLGYSRAGAGVLVFSKQTPDLLAGIAGCLWRLGGAAARRWSGTARPASTATAAGRRRRSPRSAASCRSAGTSASRPTRRPRASSSACRAIAETNFEPGRRVRQRARLPGPARRLV